MSSKIVGLSPEASSVVIGMIEHCLNHRVCMGMDEGFKSFDPDIEHDFVKELRTFVDAPVVDRQPVAYLAEPLLGSQAGRKFVSAPDQVYNRDLYNGPFPVYAAPPELAELQATIARLTAENEQLTVDLVEAKAGASRSKLGHKQLCAKHAETLAEIERLKGGQGEPVAWQRMSKMEGGRWFELPSEDVEQAIGAGYEVRKLFLSTAPVPAALPDRPGADEDDYKGKTDYEKGLLHGGIEMWDKVKELNQ